MLVKTLEVGFLQTNCYVVTDEESLVCAVVDPGGESSVILRYLEDHKLRCEGILLTHGHFDHCLAVAPLVEATGAPVYMCQRDVETDIGNRHWSFELPEDTRFVDDEDEIEVGPLLFRVIACPGHTPGSLTYQIEDCLFTGDTLFRMSWGRTDLPGGSELELGLSLMRLRDLEGDYEVYPGHEDCSTLEHERRFNPAMLRR